ncbi:CPBP family intramembrane glutamic endopeptidase [Flavicella marina]|uniref:CPBP family intramembrane glutamic endopeptidase n=1 Tax=Flavicella marina TaxID=1475951 RepID=UPI001264742C|nr:CPBP family intramembrane glutamic endopeptidase [Flavicella marina]
MAFLEKGFLGLIDWWRYLVVLSLMIAGIAIFSIPHGAAISLKTALGEADATRLDDVSYLMSLFESNLNLFYITLPFVGGLLFLWIGVKKVHRQNLVNLTTGRSRIDWSRVRFSFGFWTCIVALFVAIQLILAPETLVFNFQLKSFLILVVIAVIMVPIQTSFEEYLFRGYLMQGLGVLSKNRWFPLLFTSVVFGVMHISNPEVAKLGKVLLVYYIGTGFFLGIITLMDDGMELSLGFHAANNLISALLVTADWQVFQTYSVFKDVSEPTLFISIVPPLVLFPIATILYAKKYGWSDWRQRLTGSIELPK